MGICDNYEAAREIYAAVGVDTDAAIEMMDKVPVSVNCWQIDDLSGFEAPERGLSGGIAAFGDAPGKPTTKEEYIQDLEMALSLIPGAKSSRCMPFILTTAASTLSATRLSLNTFRPGSILPGRTISVLILTPHISAILWPTAALPFPAATRASAASG